MGFMDVFKRRPANDAVNSGGFLYRMNVPGLRFASGMTPEKLYKESPPLRSVVDFLARNVAQLPLKVYVREDDNSRSRDTESSVYLTLSKPNGNMTSYEIIFSTVVDLCLYAYALWFPSPSKTSESGYEIEWIPASWVTSTKSDGLRVTKFKIQNPDLTDSEGKWYDASEFIVFSNYDPISPGLPVSPVDSLKDVLVEQINASKFRNQVWNNGARISAVVKHDPSVGQLSQEAVKRLEKGLKENFSGNGVKAGGVAYLGPGLSLDTLTFNAKETEWVEAEKMARQDVAAVYGVNPAMVWSGEGQSYASAKDNARSLYTETLAPTLKMLTDRINAFLVPRLGGKPGTYCEFDLQAKLNGSFEEQAVVMSQAVGGPWMTRAEARARMNLPALPEDQGANELIVPLNVLVGGQANPHDTDTSYMDGNEALDSIRGWSSARVDTKGKPQEADSVIIKGSPRVEDAQAITETFRKFFKRQGKSVLSQIDRARDKGTLAQYKAPLGDVVAEAPDWYDVERWDKELRDDLWLTASQITYDNVKEILEELYVNPGAYDEAYAYEYLNDMISNLAHDVNVKTLEDLINALYEQGYSLDDALKSTPQGVFEFSEGARATMHGTTVATRIRGWSSIAAVHMSGLQDVTYKTWVVKSKNPRPSHARLGGETIPYLNPKYGEPLSPGSKRTHGEHNRFSNGLRWPGDFSSNVKEVAGCQCEMTLEVRGRDATRS